MHTAVSPQAVERYARAGYVAVEGLLEAGEVDHWRQALDEAIERHIAAQAHHNQGAETYYKDVFVQCVNLWKTDAEMRRLALDRRLGRLAAALAQVEGVRLYHDHALVKEPGANPTNWHVDNPYDPFYSYQAIMLWIALDEATLPNGCMYFLPGTHRTSRFDLTSNLSGGMGDIFADYPQWRAVEPQPLEVKAGDGVFISGMVAHAAGPNMTTARRRAFALLFMPQGATYNGRPAALPPELVERLQIGDQLDDDQHLPLVWSQEMGD